MKLARRYHSCQLLKGDLVVMGGKGAYTSVEILNISSLIWRTGPSLSTSFYKSHSLVFQSTLFLLNVDGKVVKLTNDEKWEDVANIGDVGWRPAFPALVATPAGMGC